MASADNSGDADRSAVIAPARSDSDRRRETRAAESGASGSTLFARHKAESSFRGYVGESRPSGTGLLTEETREEGIVSIQPSAVDLFCGTGGLSYGM